MSLCEYNPRYCKPATEPPSPGDCGKTAQVWVGRQGKWHLCPDCAALPVFQRLISRGQLSMVNRQGGES